MTPGSLTEEISRNPISDVRIRGACVYQRRCLRKKNDVGGWRRREKRLGFLGEAVAIKSGACLCLSFSHWLTLEQSLQIVPEMYRISFFFFWLTILQIICLHNFIIRDRSLLQKEEHQSVTLFSLAQRPHSDGRFWAQSPGIQLPAFRMETSSTLNDNKNYANNEKL